MSPGIAVVGEGADASTFREIVGAARQAELMNTGPFGPSHGPDVSGVVVADPLAPSVIERALRAGRNVLAMPPMSSGPAESAHLESLAEECGMALQVGFPMRFARPLSIARDLLDSDIREPLFVRVASAVDSCSGPESLARQGLLDEIDLVGALTGQPVVRVRAILDEGAVSGLVQLETPGPFGLIDIGGAGPDGPLLEILATEGSLIVDGPPASRLRHISVNGDVVVAGTEMVDIRRGGLSSLLTEFIAQMRRDARRRTESDAYALSVGRAIWQSVTTGDSVQVDRAPKPNR